MQDCFMLLLLLVFVCGATGRHAGQDRAMFEADHGSNSDQEDLEIEGPCMECFQESTDDDVTVDVSDAVVACIIDCMMKPEDNGHVLADVGTRKWVSDKKLRHWFHNNKTFNLNGVKTPGKIMEALAGK